MYFNQIHEYFLVTTNAGVIMKTIQFTQIFKLWSTQQNCISALNLYAFLRKEDFIVIYVQLWCILELFPFCYVT